MKIAFVILVTGVVGLMWVPPGLGNLVLTVVCLAGMVTFFAARRVGNLDSRFSVPSSDPGLMRSASSIKKGGIATAAVFSIAITGGLSTVWLPTAWGEYKTEAAAAFTVLILVSVAVGYILRVRFFQLKARS